MELHGEAYLFNLSLLAITFAAVSVLVMLVRQTMGGRLSNFDIHLITSYIARGFVIAVAAILPSLVADFGLPRRSSGLRRVGLRRFCSQPLWRLLSTSDPQLPEAGYRGS